MLERKFGDNTTYTLTVDEMAGVYDMLEESHFPISVTFTFLAEWFRSAGFHGTADEMLDVLNGYLEAEDEPYTDMRPFIPSHIAKSDENKLLKHMSCKCANEEKEEVYEAMRLKPNDNLEGIMSAVEYQKLFKEAEALIYKEEGENDES